MTNSTALTLAPCPFCGGAAHCNDFRGGAGYWQVECQDCDATSDGRRIKTDAIAAWNRRAELAASADAGRLAESRRLASLPTRDSLRVALACPAPADANPVQAKDGEFESAAKLVDELKDCKTNGESLALILRYRLQTLKQWLPAPADGLTTLAVTTHHPQDYTLHNAAGGTTWRGTADGQWVAEAVSAQGDERAGFEAAWQTEISNNGGNAPGADYRHWMLAGWQAHAQAAQGDEVDAAGAAE